MSLSTSLLLLVVAMQSCMPSPIPNDGHDQTHHKLTPEEYIANGGNADEYEYDIVLPRKRNGVSSSTRLWPKGQIPYTIDSSLDASARFKIQQAMDHIHQHTCVRWVPYTNQWNSVRLTKSPDESCNSKVGVVMLGKQKINIPDWCVNSFGSLVHEMMHTIGFYHEHNRPDRDNYVTIMWDDVNSAGKGAFTKTWSTNSNTFGTQYDFGSLMHYGARAFSKDGVSFTIVPKNGVPTSAIGQRNGLSASDIYKVNAMYGCSNTGGGTGTPTGGSCADQNASCAAWAASGECQRNPNYMATNCKKSCGGCSGGGGTCADQNASCAGWASAGECQSNPNYMMSSCKKSCGAC